ncbi:hypothetical protein B0H13DRAFT_2670434 [Mycena leptocephala]|nr:hypothetical protein B0H13DRAFT_2670434 [Mycena leptocephala]
MPHYHDHPLHDRRLPIPPSLALTFTLPSYYYLLPFISPFPLPSPCPSFFPHADLRTQFSKIGKVMHHIHLLDAAKVPRDDEFHFRDRAKALVDKWHEILNSNSTT